MRRSHLVCLLLLVAGIAGLRLLDRDADEDLPTPDRRAAGTLRESPVLLHGEARAPGAAPISAQASTPGETLGERLAAGGSEHAGPAQKIMLSVTVRVEGTPGPVSFDPPASLGFYPITLRTDSTFDVASVETLITATGTVELDVGEPLREHWSRRSNRDAEVLFRHPSYLPVTVQIPVPAVGKKPEPLDLVLRPASRLTGRVVGPDGRPLPDAEVLLYPMTSDGPDRKPTACGSTAEDGRFDLPYGSDGRYLLVATWMPSRFRLMLVARTYEQLRPGREIVDLVVGHSPPPTILRLQPPHAIRGRVLLDGRPVDLASVTWKLEGPGRRLFTSAGTHGGAWDSGLFYADGEVHSGWDDVNTDSEGRFAIHGLSARPYLLSVSALGRTLVHPKVTDQVVRTITPPQTDVLFDIHLARIEVLATQGGAPVAGVEAHISAVGMEPGLPEGVIWGTQIQSTDTDGRTEVGVSPTGLYYVFVRDARYEPFFQKVTAPAAGETFVVRAELKQAHPKPRLLVTLVGEGADALESAGFGFYAPDKKRTDRSPSPLRSVKPTDGQFVLEDLSPGKFRLHVRPERFWHQKPNTWAEATRLVQIPESGDTFVRIPIAQGGRLQVTVTDVHDRHLPAGCRIEDSAGTWIRAWFVTQDSIGNTVMAGNSLPDLGPCWVEPVLPPGSYTLSFTHPGYRGETRQVELKPAGTCAIRLVLQSLR